MVRRFESAPLLCALLISMGLHLALLWRSPVEQQHQFQAPSGQPMAVTLGVPEPKKIIQPKSLAEQLIMTQAKDALTRIAPEIEKIEPVEPDIIGELEELIVTKEVQLSSRPIPPVYPEKSRRDRQEGLVLVRAQVNQQGKTLAVKVAQSSGFPLLDQAALDAVLKWSFLPATQNEQTIMAWIEVPIDFKLR